MSSLNTPFFEGWYLKHQTRDKKALALIPALHREKDGSCSASLQIISEQGAWWLLYPQSECIICKKPFQIHLGESTFGEQGICLQVERANLSLQGTLHYGAFTPLRSDIMGPFRFLPGMECIHGVLSMGHPLAGSLCLNGETMDFSGGLGYTETDRGRSFPHRYLWTQCLWETPQPCALMLSIATVPVAVGHFTGCICAVLHHGREYRLATYRGVRLVDWGREGAELRQGKYRLRVELLRSFAQPLRAPVDGAMGRVIHESLCSKVRYRFWVGETLLFDHTDIGASFEYAH